MKNNLEQREKRKKKQKIASTLQAALILSGIILVVLICVGEIKSLSLAVQNRPDDKEVSEALSDTKMKASESGLANEDETVSEKTTDAEDTAKSETGADENETEINETEIREKSEEEKLNEVFANRYRYPEKILGMLDKNMETLDFVYDYPLKEGGIYAYSLDDADMKKNGIPLLIQWDERWGYGKYGENIVGTSGCGPACMAMVIAGLTGNTRVTPYTMAVYSEKNGYLTEDGDTMWSFITNGGIEFGVQGQTITLNEETVTETLEQGFPIICSVRPGDFTDNGHFIVLADYTDGKIKVNDPYSYANSEKLWSFEDLQPQIKNLWKMWAIPEDEDSKDAEDVNKTEDAIW